MSRKTFLTIVSFTAIAVGAFALITPSVLIETVKVAAPSGSANVMARTTGILLVAMGTLNFLVRGHDDSPTMRAVLLANMLLQIGILPIDPLAWASGVFTGLGSFVPNTILHVVLAAGFAYYLLKMQRPTTSAPAS